jgi:hypothetical protein
LSNLLREFLGRLSSGSIDLDHAVPHLGPGRRARPSIPRRNHLVDSETALEQAKAYARAERERL